MRAALGGGVAGIVEATRRMPVVHCVVLCDKGKGEEEEEEKEKERERESECKMGCQLV